MVTAVAAAAAASPPAVAAAAALTPDECRGAKIHGTGAAKGAGPPKVKAEGATPLSSATEGGSLMLKARAGAAVEVVSVIGARVMRGAFPPLAVRRDPAASITSVATAADHAARAVTSFATTLSPEFLRASTEGTALPPLVVAGAVLLVKGAVTRWKAWGSAGRSAFLPKL